MRQTKVSYACRILILCLSIFPTVFELLDLLLGDAPQWFLSFPRPLVVIRVLSWMIFSEKTVLVFVLLVLLCLIPGFGCIFVRNNRIIYLLTVTLPFSISALFLLVAMIFSTFSFSNYGLSWCVDIVCLSISLYIYVSESAK